MEYAKKIINPRPQVNEELIAKCAEMRDVLSVSAVFSDAFKRDGVMDHEIKFRSSNKPFIGSVQAFFCIPEGGESSRWQG